MNTDIQITAEELIKQSVKRYATEQSTAEILIAETIHQLYPNHSGDIVRAISLKNSVQNGILKAERMAAAHESEFALIGQLSLLGDLIPEHKVPKQLLSKSTSEMYEWMQNRAKIEQENADELRKAAEAQQNKADKFASWSHSVSSIYHAIIEMKLNPDEVTYAEALKQAQAFQPGDRSVPRETTKQPLR